jgi:3-deoxy-D-manno-octulosonic acid (KDO) 8-phosphate synthase
MDGKTSINECLFPKIIIFQLPSKQKELLWALCREGKTQNLTAKKFLNKYKLTASMVQAAIKGLLEKDYVSCELGTYFVYDKFLAEWMLRKMG